MCPRSSHVGYIPSDSPDFMFMTLCFSGHRVETTEFIARDLTPAILATETERYSFGHVQYGNWYVQSLSTCFIDPEPQGKVWKVTGYRLECYEDNNKLPTALTSHPGLRPEATVWNISCNNAPEQTQGIRRSNMGQSYEQPWPLQ